jgi:hypothetical protein
MSVDNMEQAPECNISVRAYKNGKTMEQCKEEARKNTALLSDEVLKKGEVSWAKVLEVADNDELVYKLTLKYLRQTGFDIGNNKVPRVKSPGNTTGS